MQSGYHESHPHRCSIPSNVSPSPLKLSAVDFEETTSEHHIGRRDGRAQRKASTSCPCQRRASWSRQCRHQSRQTRACPWSDQPCRSSSGRRIWSCQTDPHCTMDCQPTRYGDVGMMEHGRENGGVAYRANLSAVSVMPSLAFCWVLLVESGVTDSEISANGCQMQGREVLDDW